MFFSAFKPLLVPLEPFRLTLKVVTPEEPMLNVCARNPSPT